MSARRVIQFLTLTLFLLIRTAIADGVTKTEETWDAVFLGNEKVGYVHTLTRPIEENGKTLVHVRTETVMSIKRFNQIVEMKLDYQSYETPEGQVVRMDNRGMDTHTIGVVEGNLMRLTMETPGKRSTQSIPWGSDILGPGTESRMFKKKPLGMGEKRSNRTFLPDLNQVVTNNYFGEETEQVKMHDGSDRTLKRIRSEIEGVPALKNIKTFMWVDETGESIKTYTSLLAGMTTYRVSKEVATAPSVAFSSDFGEKTLIKVATKVPRPFDTTEIVYKLSLRDEDPEEVFPCDGRQSLAKADDGSWLLTIRAVDPTEPVKDPVKVEMDEFLRPNNWLQTDHPKVVQATKSAVGDATDPWEKARRIERWVYENVTEKNFSKVFDSAGVVADKLEGDCTEHGVLLAAMARVAGIPSRVAVGLVFADRLGAFGYHMWAEVYMNGRWVPLDGTLGLGHASPAHIKLADSSLEGVDAMAAFLPVVRVMDRLKIEPVSWKYRAKE